MKLDPEKREVVELGPVSEYCEIRGSVIHGRGLFARQWIPEETQLIQYLGEKISKKESDRRGWAQMEHAKKTGDAGVYLFTLNKRYDIDGNVPWNPARLVNHSCEPNCEAYIEDGEIWLWSIRDIELGEELFFNYGFDLENYEDHPCRCSSKRCVGYIAGEDYWPELKRLQKKKAAKALKRKKAGKGKSKRAKGSKSDDEGKEKKRKKGRKGKKK